MAFTYTGEMVDLSFGRGWLNRPAANSIRRIDRQLGHPLQITEAGRTWAKQNGHYQTYLRVGYPIALSPNTPSVHQLGGAIDSNEAQRIVAILEDHGWRRTVYRWVNGVWTLVEPWHFEYFEHLDNHRNEPAGGNATPIEEDDMPWTPEQLEKLIHDTVVSTLRSDEFDELRTAQIADAILRRNVSAETGSLAETVRDARQIARRTEVQVIALRAALDAMAAATGADPAVIHDTVEKQVSDALSRLRITVDAPTSDG